MKNFRIFLAGLFFMLGISSSISYASCPVTSCDGDCGSGGQGCQITQYENGQVCSTTICNGKRGNIE